MNVLHMPRNRTISSYSVIPNRMSRNLENILITSIARSCAFIDVFVCVQWRTFLNFVFLVCVNFSSGVKPVIVIKKPNTKYFVLTITPCIVASRATPAKVIDPWSHGWVPTRTLSSTTPKRYEKQHNKSPPSPTCRPIFIQLLENSVFISTAVYKSPVYNT